jgi:hypothetical protein
MLKRLTRKQSGMNIEQKLTAAQSTLEDIKNKWGQEGTAFVEVYSLWIDSIILPTPGLEL